MQMVTLKIGYGMVLLITQLLRVRHFREVLCLYVEL